MRLKFTWPLFLVIGLGCVVAFLMVAKWAATMTDKTGVEIELSRNQADLDATSKEPATPLPSPPALIPKPGESQEWSVIPDTQRAPEPERPRAAEQTPWKQTRESSRSTDAAAKAELGRLALSYVGADPLADEIWLWLINDPELSVKVREDLIEDLNENGFSDGNGRRATVDDLPLIESRILLLAEHAPVAMDEMNAAAFAEAYKDLANMWWRLNQW